MTLHPLRLLSRTVGVLKPRAVQRQPLRQEGTVRASVAMPSDWFDSSNELRRGLEVSELDAWPETRPAAFSLG
jgi:hypothetical protein